MSKDDVVLTLSRAEALVLFEWLARSENGGLLETECSAEQKLLWKVEGLLEKQVRDFAPDFKQMLGAAREEVDLSN
jgi:hypothetical protein